MRSPAPADGARPWTAIDCRTNQTAQPPEYGIRLDWDPSPVADLKEYWLYEQPTRYDEPRYLGIVDAANSQTVLRTPANGPARRFVVVGVLERRGGRDSGVTGAVAARSAAAQRAPGSYFFSEAWTSAA
ncbi:hypothetical protein [Streptomyces sp. ATMOS53]